MLVHSMRMRIVPFSFGTMTRPLASAKNGGKAQDRLIGSWGFLQRSKINRRAVAAAIQEHGMAFLRFDLRQARILAKDGKMGFLAHGEKAD